MRKGLITICGIIVLLFPPFDRGRADDREIMSGSTAPYVMFVFDNSGSMSRNDFLVCADSEPAKLAAFQTYTTSTGRTYTYATTHAAHNYKARRIVALQRIATQLADEFRDDIHMGFSHFFHTGQSWKRAHGARVFADVRDLSSGDAARDAALDALTDYINNDMSAMTNHFTPLAESLDTAYGYFAGMINSGDGNAWLDYTGSERIPQPTYVPPQYSCQNTFVIFLSDGDPTADDFGLEKNTPPIDGYSQPYTGADPVPAEGRSSYNKLPLVAKTMYENPIAPATTGIMTYTVSLKLAAASNAVRMLRKTADMNHGHGRYFPGDDYEELKESLLSAIGDILQRNYAFTEYTSPKKIAGGGIDHPVSYSGYFFSTSAKASLWEGHLKCNEIVETGGTYEFQERWDTAVQLLAQGHAGRNLTTRITGIHDHVMTPVNFEVSQAAVLKNALGAASISDAEKVIRFIRGDRLPGEPQYLLADIFHSDIVYVGSPLAWKAIYNPEECDPTNPLADDDCYQKFYEDMKNRAETVYVGTNDGVLHTIRGCYQGGQCGEEQSGFIADEVLHRLRTIALDGQYTYTADGPMAANDIYAGPADHWRTILIQGFRRGGRAYYCHDITDPDHQERRWRFPAYQASGEINVVSGLDFGLIHLSGSWEIDQLVVNQQRTASARVQALSGAVVTLTDVDGTFQVGDKLLAMPFWGRYVGDTWGRPVIGRIRYKKGAAGIISTWVVIVPGGHGDGSDGRGKGLFILDAWTGEPIWWFGYSTTYFASDDYLLTDGDFGNGPTLDYPIPQSMRVIDRDNDTYLDTIYFGNLGGNLFAIDLSDPQTSLWTPRILFHGNDPQQPIYLPPSISYDQCYKLWVHVGTGNRDHPQDGPAGLFLGLKDDESVPLTGCELGTHLEHLPWAGDTLAKTTLSPGFNGWYFHFPDQDEIIFEPDPMILPVNGMPTLFFNTYQPSEPVMIGDPCGTGGNMKLYVLGLYYCGEAVGGGRDDGRISGGGLLDGDDYLMYVGTGETGSIDIKKFEKYKLPYPGGVIYQKETKR